MSDRFYHLDAGHRQVWHETRGQFGSSGGTRRDAAGIATIDALQVRPGVGVQRVDRRSDAGVRHGAGQWSPGGTRCRRGLLELGHRLGDSALRHRPSGRVLDPHQRDEAIHLVAAMISHDGPIREVHLVAGDAGGDDAALHKRDVVEREAECRKGLVDLGDERRHVLERHASGVGAADAGPVPGTNRELALAGEREQQAARRRRRPARDRWRGPACHQVHGFDEERGLADAGARRQSAGGGARRIDGDACVNRKAFAANAVARQDAPHGFALTNWFKAVDVVRQHGARGARGQRHTQRQAFGMLSPIVVPDSNRPVVEQRARVDGGAGRGSHESPWREAKRRLHALVAVRRKQRVGGQAGLQQPRRLAAIAAHPNRERLTCQKLRRDARPDATFAHGFSKTRQIAGLQVPQSAVQGPMMVERRAAAEILSLDERDVEATRGRVPRGHQAVDAATDHEYVEAARNESVEIANHANEGETPGL